jgi:prepilin signal peptidase PulO-like enzyme (type II secretory pathway)
MTLMPHTTHAAVTIVVSLLGVWQIPLDIRQRMLSRRATLGATLAVLGVICTDAVVRRAPGRLGGSLVWVAGIGGVYAVMHRVSPHSLGFGDVLLVVPLTMAVSYVAASHVLVWQLLSALSGASHALVTRSRNRSRSVPFGPHLLIAAWLVLVLSL